MGDNRHVEQFDRSAYQNTVTRMRARGEDVHAAGRKVLEATGGLHPNVDIVGKQPRVSNNAMVPGDEPGTYVLSHGVSLPVLSLFDGTGSTAMWVKDFFFAAERQYLLLDGVRSRYNPQLASGVVNDVYNVYHDSLPVVQVSQFESNEESANQVRLLQPASMGNDSTTEDYDLGLYYSLLVNTDIRSYGLKGYLTLTLDEIGRGCVTRADVMKYLGHAVDMDSMSTAEICQRLLDEWHVFILQVPSGGHRMLHQTTKWWSELVGSSRVLKVEDPHLLAQVRAALVYVTEAVHQPTFQGLTEFLATDNADTRMNAADLDRVWRIIQPAAEHFGAQAVLPGYQTIPRRGDVFAHWRNPWPIGHARESENFSQSLEDVV